MCADLGGKNLDAGSWLETIRGRWGADELAALGQDEQFFPCQRQSCGAECLFLPTYLSGLQLDATQAGGRLEAGIGPPVNAEHKPMMMNRGCIMTGDRVIGGPYLFRCFFCHSQQNGPGPIAGGEEYQVANDQWRGGANGASDGRPKGKLKEDVSGGQIGSHQSRARQTKRQAPAADRSRYRRGVTGFIIRRLPKNFSICLVEGHDAPATTAADNQQNGVALDQWRAG